MRSKKFKLYILSTSIMVILLSVFILNGCDWVRESFPLWVKQLWLKKESMENPSVRVLQRLNTHDMYLLTGNVTFNRKYKGPVLIVAVTDKIRKREVVATKILPGPVNAYEIFLLEGNYDLYFFADIHPQNGSFEASEMIGPTSGNSVKVTNTDVRNSLISEGPAFSLDLDHPTNSDLNIRRKVREKPYVFDITDEFFNEKYGKIGFEDPGRFLAFTQRHFFALEEFDSNKTVVLFVHGAKGTPKDFEYLVERLDRKRFQPWFYYYPSNLPLDKLGALLADGIGSERSAFRSSRLIVVAHSMGGLVALSALNELCDNGVPPYLKGFISFVSPYGGVEGAKNAKRLPVKIPCWIDTATDSPFLIEKIYPGKAITRIPFYLFFGWKTGESSDGKITLNSQLDKRVHFYASKSYGFNTMHENILNDPESRRQFLNILDVLDRK